MYWLTKVVKYKLLLTVVMAVFLSIVMVPAIYAADPDIPDINFGLTYGEKTGLGKKDIRETIASIINVALSLLGIVAVVIILAGGFQWMTAGGNEEKVTAARKLIFAGIIGLAIILAAYAIAKFVLTQLYAATKGTEYTQETL